MDMKLNKKWTICVDYNIVEESGKKRRARTVVNVEAPGIKEAYLEAEKSIPPDAKLGAIIPGHHQRFP